MSTARVPFVALTGGIGAGKSTALDALGRLGAAVLSTDQVVHDLYLSAEVRDAVVARFGAEVAPDGVVDRRAVADRMFAGAEDRGWVEGLLWPRVGERMAAWRDEVAGRDPAPAAAVVEVPLLFESGMAGVFDATIAVVADEAVRSERAGGRGHAAVAERTARQLTQEEKAAQAQYVVHNDGTPAELERALSAVLDMLRK
ncbi:MAG TPA: dephospho-CoA kinase [Solirubrobacteraceae bacterium]|nr:dephospho-CoA kinase [Solirubrobacteraceae bacterium]